jgi:hypothetical protein
VLRVAISEAPRAGPLAGTRSICPRQVQRHAATVLSR